MKVFKFGGASVKDADSIKNVKKVLLSQGYQNTLMVISAMGKTTNQLEEVVKAYFDKEDYIVPCKISESYHIEIAKELFPKAHSIFDEIYETINEIIYFLRKNKSPNYDFVYDQVVSVGEILSSKIMSEFLKQEGIENTWIDFRDYIKTDGNYREGKVNWYLTQENFKNFPKNEFFITQGFIGSDENNFTVTLGREGSDYSAAIASFCLDAESMTIWKDVPGVLSSDPRYFDEYQLIEKLPYQEAIEMAFYGASVIHPKTIKPLQNKKIPFYIKSFLDPKSRGTVVGDFEKLQPEVSCCIMKKNQILLEISPKDFSFIAEENLSHILNLLNLYKTRISMLQITAVSLYLCVEDKHAQIQNLLNELQKNYQVDMVKDVNLYTIRHFDSKSRDKIFSQKKILLEQTIQNTLQIVSLD